MVGWRDKIKDDCPGLAEIMLFDAEEVVAHLDEHAFPDASRLNR